MRRKVIQDFANVFCQRFIQVPNGYDLVTFVHLGSGLYVLDVLNGVCTRDSSAIPKLRTCDEQKEWLAVQLDKHHIPWSEIKKATLEIGVVVSKITVKESFGKVFASADFSFECRCGIRTDKKS